MLNTTESVTINCINIVYNVCNIYTYNNKHVVLLLVMEHAINNNLKNAYIHTYIRRERSQHDS